MTSVTLTIQNLKKTFNLRPVLRNISMEVTAPGSLAITGRNGAGKSTLVKIIAGVLAPSSGTIELVVGGAHITPDERYRHMGFVSPYLFLYDEFSARENLEILGTMRSGSKPQAGQIDELFELVGLRDRQHDRLGTYSSGMKQRVKYMYAMLHRPALLVLDEPSSNLDEDGYLMVERIVRNQEKEGIVVVATNEADEAAWCGSKIELKNS